MSSSAVKSSDRTKHKMEVGESRDNRRDHRSRLRGSRSRHSAASSSRHRDRGRLCERRRHRHRSEHPDCKPTSGSRDTRSWSSVSGEATRKTSFIKTKTTTTTTTTSSSTTKTSTTNAKDEKRSGLNDKQLKQLGNEVIDYSKQTGLFDEMLMQLMEKVTSSQDFKQIEREFKQEIDKFCSTANLNLPRTKLREQLGEESLFKNSASRLRQCIRRTQREQRHKLDEVYTNCARFYLSKTYDFPIKMVNPSEGSEANPHIDSSKIANGNDGACKTRSNSNRSSVSSSFSLSSNSPNQPPVDQNDNSRTFQDEKADDDDDDIVSRAKPTRVIVFNGNRRRPSHLADGDRQSECSTGRGSKTNGNSRRQEEKMIETSAMLEAILQQQQQQSPRRQKHNKSHTSLDKLEVLQYCFS